MSRVGTIDGLGIRYGLTMNAWISSASATAIATVITSSISPFIAGLQRLTGIWTRESPYRNPIRSGGQ